MLTEKQLDLICHHGIIGQHWGQQNGPPYPLDRAESRRIKKQGRIDKRKNKLLQEGDMDKIYKNRNLFTNDEMQTAIDRSRQMQALKRQANDARVTKRAKLDSFEAKIGVGRGAAKKKLADGGTVKQILNKSSWYTTDELYDILSKKQAEQKLSDIKKDARNRRLSNATNVLRNSAEAGIKIAEFVDKVNRLKKGLPLNDGGKKNKNKNKNKNYNDDDEDDDNDDEMSVEEATKIIKENAKALSNLNNKYSKKESKNNTDISSTRDKYEKYYYEYAKSLGYNPKSAEQYAETMAKNIMKSMLTGKKR